MRDYLDSAKPIYWTLIVLTTLFFFWSGLAYENPLWELFIPITIAPCSGH